eukprot:13366465-Alexandrium_andersonii.AAC.1
MLRFGLPAPFHRASSNAMATSAYWAGPWRASVHSPLRSPRASTPTSLATTMEPDVFETHVTQLLLPARVSLFHLELLMALGTLPAP